MWPFKSHVQFRDSLQVRMEAVGGQGAHSAGRILAEAGVLGMGYSGNHFSSFGSEKRGSHVRSFVRLGLKGQPVRTASEIRHPDLVVVFQDSLLETHPECWTGVGKNTDLIISSAAKNISIPENLEFRQIGVLDALAMSQNHGCGLNAVLLGAASKFIPEIEEKKILESLQGYFSKLSAKAMQRNLEGFAAGRKVKIGGQALRSSVGDDKVDLPTLGYMNAPLGGVVINPGNTILKNNSASRKGVVPKFIQEVCFNCGFCDMVCPDFCFVWDKTGRPVLQGIDYQYCKGCGKCISACPVEALTPIPESDLPEANRKHLFPDQREKLNASHQVDWQQLMEDQSNLGQMRSPQSHLLDPSTYQRPDFSKYKLPDNQPFEVKSDEGKSKK